MSNQEAFRIEEFSYCSIDAVEKIAISACCFLNTGDHHHSQKTEEQQDPRLSNVKTDDETIGPKPPCPKTRHANQTRGTGSETRSNSQRQNQAPAKKPNASPEEEPTKRDWATTAVNTQRTKKTAKEEANQNPTVLERKNRAQPTPIKPEQEPKTNGRKTALMTKNGTLVAAIR